MTEQEYKECLKKALTLLKELASNQESDFYEDFVQTRPNMDLKIDEAVRAVEASEALNYKLLKQLMDILNFNRLYPVIELAEKFYEASNIWAEKLKAVLGEQIRPAYWGFTNDALEHLIAKCKKIIRKAFLELVFRKGRGETEIEAIKSFRYSMGSRLPEEYLLNLVLGWAVEDLVKIWLINRLEETSAIATIEVEEIAHDASRVIRFHGPKITGEADLKLKIELVNGSVMTFYVEIQRADRSRKRRSRKFENRIVFEKVEVPSHRIEQSRQSELRGIPYIIVFADFKRNEVAIVKNPHRCCQKENGKAYVWAHFVPPLGPRIQKELETTLQYV